MGVNEWLCEEFVLPFVSCLSDPQLIHALLRHGCLTRTDWLPNMDETRVRNGNFIGGGSVIGKYHWSEEEYESSRLEHMTQAEKEEFWSQQNGEVLVVEGEDKGGQFQGSDSKAEGMGEQDSGDVMAEGGDAVLVEMDDAEPLEETEQPPNYTDTMQNGDKQLEDDSNVQVEAIPAGEEMPMLGEMEMGVF